ncbi:MAG: sigma-54-dependent transcriptional regulator [Candidatus Aminicenantales bacterium]
MENILIIDDEKSLLDLLSVVLKKEGYRVKTCLSPSRVFDLLEKESFDLLVCDIKLPEISGMEVLKYVRENKPDLPVIMITAYGSLKQAVEALKAGAIDYILKPFDVEELKIIIAQELEKRRLREENILLRRDLQQRYSFENMIGKSKAMQEVYGLIEKSSTTDSTVLITGESGTGKEMAARAIHFLSRRSERPFVSINCAALPENLLESELFGHVKGSFTGAVADKKGMFEVAQRGTLFLDEVGETSPLTQVKLLRALQERRIRRVGGTEEIQVDVRIIAATNLDLKRRIEEGKFREELFYRLNVISFEMPPLRKRVEDIPLLVQHFLQKYCQQMGKKMKRLAPDVISYFEAYPWPGNVRELENVIERVVAIEDRETVTVASLPREIVAPPRKAVSALTIPPQFNLMDHLDVVAREYITRARAMAGGNLRKTASLLGISYRSLRHMIQKYGLNKTEKSGMGSDRQEYKPAL